MVSEAHLGGVCCAGDERLNTRMPRRVLIFSLAYYPNHVSGAEIAIREITDRIPPSDIAFDLITLRFEKSDPREEQIGNVHVYRVGGGSSYISKICFPLNAVRMAGTLHRRHRYGGMWAIMTYMLLPVMLANYFGVRVPHALTLQDGDPYEKVFGRFRVRAALPLIDRGFRRARVVQAVSTYLAEWPKKRGFGGEVVLIPNGASIESAQEYPREALALLAQEVGKKEGDVLLLSISRLVYQKGLENIIRALPLLPEHVRYLCVGDGEERPTLEALARELNVAHRVVFTGKVDRAMTAKYRRISDIFVLPSRSEGQGISFLSTMVSGLPMIATQVGGIADFLFDAGRNPEREPTGFAVDPDAPEQIAAHVRYIIAHPEEAKKVAANARAFAHSQFDWEVIAHRMRTEVFEQLL